MYRAAVEQNATLVTIYERGLQTLKAQVNSTDGEQIRFECNDEAWLPINFPESFLSRGGAIRFGRSGWGQCPATHGGGIPWSQFEAFGPDQFSQPDWVMILAPLYVKADRQVN